MEITEYLFYSPLFWLHIDVIHCWFNLISTHKVMFQREKNKKKNALCIHCVCVCVSYFLYFGAERCETEQGFALGVSSFVEYTVVRVDVAAVSGYFVVFIVRLGMISCTYCL